MALKAFPTTRGRKEAGREEERKDGENKPGEPWWGHPNCCGKLLLSSYTSFKTLLLLRLRLVGVGGHTVKKGGVAPSQDEISCVLQSNVEELLCAEVSNAHLLAELGHRTLVLVVVPIPGMIKAGPRVQSFGVQSKVWGWKREWV